MRLRNLTANGMHSFSVRVCVCFRHDFARMPRVRRQVILEDPARPVTPDMVETKLRESLVEKIIQVPHILFCRASGILGLTHG